MAKRHPRHYFEPSAILAWLKRETIDDEERWWHCLQLLEQAKRGEAVIYTSGLTLAEVTGGKGKSRGVHIPAEYGDVRDVVRAFFENEYVEIVEAGRVVGELARQLIWDFPTSTPSTPPTWPPPWMPSATCSTPTIRTFSSSPMRLADWTSVTAPS